MKKVDPTVFMCKTNYHDLSESKVICGIHTSLDAYYRVQLNKYFASKMKIETSQFSQRGVPVLCSCRWYHLFSLESAPSMMRSSLFQSFFLVNCRMRVSFSTLCIGGIDICFMYMYGFTTLSNDVRITIGDLYLSIPDRQNKEYVTIMNGSNREFQLVQQYTA